MPQDPHLYGQRPVKKQKKEIPLSSSLAFTSQLTSLLSSPSSSFTAAAANAAAAASTTTTTGAAATTTTSAVSSGRPRPSRLKDDIFGVRARKKSKRKEPTTGHEHGDDDNNINENNNNNNNNNTSSSSRSRGRNGTGGDPAAARPLSLRDPRGTEDERRDFLRARRNMQEKARRYAAMKRGDLVVAATAGAAAEDDPAAPLVDFDRKWAESHPDRDDDDDDDDGGGGGGGGDRRRYSNSSSGSDNESLDEDEDGEGDRGGNPMAELVEYRDEFGRTRTGTRAEALRHARREQRRRLGAEELEAMSARPSLSSLPGRDGVIHGDVVQSDAFLARQAAGGAPAAARMADLAARRDRPPTPPADAHFDGRAEVRARGVGFYQFDARDEDARRAQMDDLRRRRRETEAARASASASASASAPAAAGSISSSSSSRDARRAHLQERRRRAAGARAGRLAESFLDGLAGEMGGGGGGGGGGDGGGGGGDGDGDGDDSAGGVAVVVVAGGEESPPKPVVSS